MPTSASASETDPAPGVSPAELGYRWPAEWEPHEATWISWPHNVETWPGRLGQAEDAMARVASLLSTGERIRITAGSEEIEARARRKLEAAGCDPGQVEILRIPSDDAWVRDHGPVFLVRDAPGDGRPARALVDFGFDAWGGKYPPWARDDAVPAEVARSLGFPLFSPGFVLEGGSIEGNGRGVVLTTESCLLDPSREGGRPRSRELMERRLAQTLGARHVIWLGDGIVGDDTDGHIDDLTRFVSPAVVVTCVEDRAEDPNHGPLQENLLRLRSASDGSGRPLQIVPLPMPAPVEADGQRLPASYANFYIGNEIVLVPTFGQPSDDRAIEILGECFSGGDGVAPRDVLPIPSRDLVVGLGAVHCLTQQEPAEPPVP